MVRFKNRYLLVSFVFPATLANPLAQVHDEDDTAPPLPQPPNLSEGGLISLLRESLSVNFGDVGAGEVGGAFSIKYLSPNTQILILRVAREHLRTLWASLTLLRRIGGHEVLTRVLHVSGTIRKIQHAAMAHDRAAILSSAKRRQKFLLPAAVGVGGLDEAAEKEVAEKIAQSEEAIMALEA
ncbi:ribonuclease P/MRP protein subunit POP5 [Pseudohyphozyma bogoriensis]|nr:ribonuclease P/MRP protein subunit POP5 [Pseudohyphozyma bogoriensis]